MAHLVEQMFSVRTTPWHGLGHVLQSAPTTEEAIRHAGLDWRVKKAPIFLEDGTEIKGKAAILRETDNQFYGIAGKVIVPLQNSESFSFFDPILQSGMATLETAGSLKHGQVQWILAKLNLDNAEIIPGDTVKPYVLLSNSHKPGQSIRVGFTPIRVVCNNTLTAAKGHAESKLIRVFHSRSAKANLDDLRDTMNILKGTFEASAEQFRQLAAKRISKSDLIRYVNYSFNFAPAMNKEMSKAQVAVQDRVIRLFGESDLNNLPGMKGTWWSAYNAVTEFISHDAGKTQETRLTKLWFGANAEVNRRALDAALAA